MWDKKTTQMDRPMVDKQVDGWMDEQCMDIKVLIKKWRDTKNTNKSCSGGENAAKASEGLMMKHRKTNKVFFTQSRSGPYGRFRWGNAPVWLSIYCWEKTKCYEGKETVSEN